ncbi:MAG: hypothetical protein J7K31_03845 [Candidatus Aenigmarchaeota archaeon]|nr:hypothetical protein [Candidatus Aenigmarchaeota archaeon]
MNEKELLVLNVLREFREFGFSDILKNVPFSREPAFRYLQSLTRQNIIKKRRIANLYLYSLNMENDETISIISFLNNRELNNSDYGPEIKKMIYEITDKNVLFIILMKKPGEKKGKKKNRRIDFVVVCSHNKKEITEKTQKMSKNLEYKTKTKIMGVVYLYEEFLDRIKEKPSYLRDLLKNHIVLFNAERFYLEIRKFLI